MLTACMNLFDDSSKLLCVRAFKALPACISATNILPSVTKPNIIATAISIAKNANDNAFCGVDVIDNVNLLSLPSVTPTRNNPIVNPATKIPYKIITPSTDHNNAYRNAIIDITNNPKAVAFVLVSCERMNACTTVLIYVKNTTTSAITPRSPTVEKPSNKIPLSEKNLISYCPL